MSEQLEEKLNHLTAVVMRHDNALSQHDQVLMHLVEKVGGMRLGAGSVMGATRYTVWKDILSHLHGYTNLLVVLGFGGVIAIWAESREIMLPWAFAITGGAVILSLLLYVATEIWIMRIYSTTLGARVPDEDMEAAHAADIVRAVKIAQAAFWPTVVLGFGGGGVMFLCYACNLMREAFNS